LAEKKSRPGLADYVAMAICPGLIMALVSSLVFFLLEIVYSGQYATRLQWLIFFFVFATVLIARISMEPAIAERAGMYGFALGLVTFVTLNTLVAYPAGGMFAGMRWLVNLGLMAIIWWSAHRLTWDCTFIDEQVDASGAGLLEVAGLEEPGATAQAQQAEQSSTQATPRKKNQPTGLEAWWQRYRAYREQRRLQPHAPGVWIIYFSVAALPLFGLGQSLIPIGHIERRRYVFWLTAIYVASGLALLLTTSFLGLRRYLRQRGLNMPAAITGVWLAIGTMMVLALLVVGAFLPRPEPEYPLFNLPGKVTSQLRQASRWSVFRSSPGKGKGAPGAEQGKQGEDEAGSGGGQDQNAENQVQGNSGNSPGGPGQAGQSGDQKGSQGSEGQQSGSQQEQSGNGQNKPGSKPGKPGEKNSKKGPASANSSPQSWQGLRLPHAVQNALAWLLPVLKWIVFGLVAFLVLFILLRAGLKFLANFTLWARNLLAALQAFWQNLFGWRADKDAASQEEERKTLAAPPRPFAAFVNPFLHGPEAHRSPEELVRYTFEALEAWATERGMSRNEEETPLEFGARVGESVRDLEVDARRLTLLYARAAYAYGRLPRTSVGVLEEFWRKLEGMEMVATGS
jgi:hypothetical protein